MTVRFFDGFEIAALTCLLCLGVGRGAQLYRQGVRVLTVDRQRSLGEGLADLFGVALIAYWACAVCAFAGMLPARLVPAPLDVVLIQSVAAKGAGAAVLVAALAVYTAALRALGGSWRLGIDRDSPGPLVTGGIFAFSRNPIYLGLDLFVAGTFLVQGRLLLGLLAAAVIAELYRQTRREEIFLAEKWGPAYRTYTARVGRYVTLRRRRDQ